eukprot:6001228-Pyramimonas_sp.AAC.2
MLGPPLRRQFAELPRVFRVIASYLQGLAHASSSHASSLHADEGGAELALGLGLGLFGERSAA